MQFEKEKVRPNMDCFDYKRSGICRTIISHGDVINYIELITLGDITLWQREFFIYILPYSSVDSLQSFIRRYRCIKSGHTCAIRHLLKQTNKPAHLIPYDDKQARFLTFGSN